MSIKLGNSNITLKVGDSAVTAAYLGTTLVYTGGTPPTPTTYTYSVTITGLENGDTTRISWSSTSDYHEDNNVGNGVYTYTTSSNWIQVNINSVTDYTVDYDNFYLDADDHFSKTVTFTHQGGGGGGLVQIPFGADMTQYVGQSISRIVVNDTTTSTSVNIFFNNWADAIFITNWNVTGQGQFSSLNTQLPIDISIPTPAILSNWSGTNPFNDLQIEWA